jgi:hypothetical protein
MAVQGFKARTNFGEFFSPPGNSFLPIALKGARTKTWFPAVRRAVRKPAGSQDLRAVARRLTP